MEQEAKSLPMFDKEIIANLYVLPKYRDTVVEAIVKNARLLCMTEANINSVSPGETMENGIIRATEEFGMVLYMNFTPSAHRNMNSTMRKAWEDNLPLLRTCSFDGVKGDDMRLLAHPDNMYDTLLHMFKKQGNAAIDRAGINSVEHMTMVMTSMERMRKQSSDTPTEFLRLKSEFRLLRLYMQSLDDSIKRAKEYMRTGSHAMSMVHNMLKDVSQ